MYLTNIKNAMEELRMAKELTKTDYSYRRRILEALEILIDLENEIIKDNVN